MKGTFEINGHHVRLDQVKLIEPLRTYTINQDGFTGIFMKESNLNYKSQYEITIWFTGKNGGYKEFRSKVVDFKGNNFKGDSDFKYMYNDFVNAWKEYHDELKVIAE